MNIHFLKRNRPAVLLSDKFRSVRFALRNLKNTIDEYEDYDKRAIPLIGTVAALANASDSALTNVEEKIHNHFSSDAKKHFGQAAACSLFSYLDREAQTSLNAQAATTAEEATDIGVNASTANTRGEPAGAAGAGSATSSTSTADEKVGLQFAGDQYFTAKRVALAFGIDNALMHQSRFLLTWGDFSRVINDSECSHGGSAGVATLPFLCASYAGLLRTNNIVVFPGKYQLSEQALEAGTSSHHAGKTLDTNVLVSATIALVTAVASYCDIHGIRKESDAIYANCVSLVHARYDAIADMFDSDEFPENFEGFLADWIPRLA